MLVKQEKNLRRRMCRGLVKHDEDLLKQNEQVLVKQEEQVLVKQKKQDL